MCGNLNGCGFLWVALTIALAAGACVSFYYPRWLIGTALVNGTNNASRFVWHIDEIDWNEYKDVEFTFSTFRRCNYWSVKAREENAFTTNVYTVVKECGRYKDFTGTEGIPSIAWRVCTIMAGVASGLLILIALIGLLAVFMKGVFSRCMSLLCAIVQFVSGLLLLAAVILYPVGWDADRVKKEACGWNAGQFKLGQCSLGWAYFIMIGCGIGVLLAAFMSPAVCGEGDDDDDDPIPSYMI